MKKEISLNFLHSLPLDLSFGNTELEQRVLASLYPLIQGMPDAPLNLLVIMNGVKASEQEVSPIFENMIKSGLLRKKYEHLNVYCLTPQGLREVEMAHRQYMHEQDQ